MSFQVTLLDHHIIPDENFIHNQKVKVILGYDQENYYKNISEFINRKFDYIFLDENPDAMLSAAIYLLSRQKKPQFKCLPRALKDKDFEKLIAGGKNNIIIFNCLKAYFSDFHMVDKIILINPHESGLQNISASEIIYKTIEDPTPFMRDLASISIVLDYTLDEAFETVLEVVNAYPDIFADILEKIKNLTLNKYNIHDSEFSILASMFRAPSILYGIKGVDQLIDYLLKNENFTLKDMLNGSANETIKYLKDCSTKYLKIIDDELKFLEEEKVSRGAVMIYTPHFRSENFVREFANQVKDRNIDSIVMFKIPTKDNKTKYSIRRGELNVDLGRILSDMGVGGGNPFSAGCTVDREEDFEKEFLFKIEQLELK